MVGRWIEIIVKSFLLIMLKGFDGLEIQLIMNLLFSLEHLLLGLIFALHHVHLLLSYLHTDQGSVCKMLQQAGEYEANSRGTVTDIGKAACFRALFFY